MTKEDLKIFATDFLNKRSKQKDNLVISRNEAISALVDFYEFMQSDEAFFCTPPNVTHCKKEVDKNFDCKTCRWIKTNLYNKEENDELIKLLKKKPSIPFDDFFNKLFVIR